jgi:hypothetical protein
MSHENSTHGGDVPKSSYGIVTWAFWFLFGLGIQAVIQVVNGRALDLRIAVPVAILVMPLAVWMNHRFGRMLP